MGRNRGNAPATAIALLALFVSIGGVGYATSKATKSVTVQKIGTKSLKNNAVNSAKVADGSLLFQDMKPGEVESVREAALTFLTPDQAHQSFFATEGGGTLLTASGQATDQQPASLFSIPGSASVLGVVVQGGIVALRIQNTSGQSITFSTPDSTGSIPSNGSQDIQFDIVHAMLTVQLALPSDGVATLIVSGQAQNGGGLFIGQALLSCATGHHCTL